MWSATDFTPYMKIGIDIAKCVLGLLITILVPLLIVTLLLLCPNKVRLIGAKEFDSCPVAKTAIALGLSS